MLPRTLFSEEHEMFRQAARRFIEKEVVPYHAQWEEDGIVDRDLWRKAGEQGLLCCTVPEEYGGPGGDFLHSAIVNEEMAEIVRVFDGVEVKGIVCNHDNIPLVECRYVYKDLDTVLDILDANGIARIDTRLFPVANIKGDD